MKIYKEPITHFNAKSSIIKFLIDCVEIQIFSGSLMYFYYLILINIIFNFSYTFFCILFKYKKLNQTKIKSAVNYNLSADSVCIAISEAESSGKLNSLF